MASKKLYEERKAQGLCTKCGKKALDGRTLCEYHNELHKKDSKKDRDFRNKMNLCVLCGKDVRIENSTRCIKCDEKQFEYRMQKGSNNLYKMRKSIGICVDCGKSAAVDGKVRCSSCIESRNEYMRNYNKSHRKSRRKLGIDRSERKAYGLCFNCGKDAIQGKGLCVECYNKNRVVRKLGIAL